MAWALLRDRQISLVAADALLRSRCYLHSFEFLRLGPWREHRLVGDPAEAALAALRNVSRHRRPVAGAGTDRRASGGFARLAVSSFSVACFLQPHLPALQRRGLAELRRDSAGGTLDADRRMALSCFVYCRRRAGCLFP